MALLREFHSFSAPFTGVWTASEASTAFHTTVRRIVENFADLWKRFLSVYRKHRVSFQWIKGHAGHPENERCDKLATAAADGTRLLTDEKKDE